MNCCEPTHNITGANEGDGIETTRRKRSESAENTGKDELAPIRAHRQTAGGNQSGEHANRATSHDVGNYRCQRKPQQRPFLMNNPVHGMTGNGTQRAANGYTAIHAYIETPANRMRIGAARGKCSYGTCP